MSKNVLYRLFFKRLIDLLVALIAFAVLSPVFLITAILLAVINRGNPFFIQKRPGKNAKIFKIVKFKTMNDQRDRYGNLLPDTVRLTEIGRFVRKTSIDEIPQLLNIIIGDMSLIGPRPLLVEYLPLYNNEQQRRHDVQPGITGWAQVNGRNSITWQQKFALDIWYVEHISFLIDLKILFLTIKNVINRTGINSSANVTMERFTGNNHLQQT